MENSKETSTEIKNPTIKLFGVYDKKAERVFDVFKSADVVSATRSFETSVNNPQSMLNKYAMDFSLVLLAEFDEKTMEVDSKIIEVATAQSLLMETKNEPTSE